MITHRLKNKSSPSRGHGPHTISACPRPPPWKKLLLGAGLLMLLTVATVAGVFIHFYLQFSRIIDARLDGNVFGNPAVILAAPSELHCGQAANARTHRGYTSEKAGYAEGQNVRGVGSFTLTANGLEVRPGPRVFLPKWSNGRRSGETGIQKRSPRVDYRSRQHDRP